jgi:DNA-binding CsgD family transcriptional regulator
MSLPPQTKGPGSSQPRAAGSRVRPASIPHLTSREREVIHWVREGKRDSEIAVILGLSSRTVEKHVGHILEKLGVETRTAAVNECHSSLALSQTAFKTSQPAFSFGHTGKSLIQESDK